MIVMLLIGGLVIGFWLAVIIAFALVVRQKKAIKDAKAIIAAGCGDAKKREAICGILGKIPNNLEASDLWHKLREMHG